MVAVLKHNWHSGLVSWSAHSFRTLVAKSTCWWNCGRIVFMLVWLKSIATTNKQHTHGRFVLVLGGTYTADMMTE